MKPSIISRKRLGLSACLGIFLSSSLAVQVKAAERVFARFFVLERSVTVESLETYAREGRFTDNLQTYGRLLNKDQRAQIREGLLTPVDIEALTIAQFLYTPIGERLLKRISDVIKPRSGVDGFFALRSALILAANEEEGMTVLNILKKYPTAGIQIDVGVALELFEEAQTLVQQTKEVVERIENLETSSEESPAPLFQADLSQAGSWSWTTTSFEFRDEGEKRLEYAGNSQTFPVDLYLPNESSNTPLPIVVISHGLNSHQNSFQYLAEHLASHGYAVLVPEHPGSSRDQLTALLAGRTNDVISRTEFIDRPLDISYTLDELERIASSVPSLNNKLDFNNVGIIGQSFGGYTALTIAGAKIDFETLQSDCDANKLDNTYNLSLLLQCLALRLTPQDYELQDPRIKGAIAINPIGSSLLGNTNLSEIQTPTLIIGGSQDKVAPLVPEQFIPYMKQRQNNHYFALVNGGTHFSFIAPDKAVQDYFPQIEQFLGKRPDIARKYLKSLSLAFLGRHIQNRKSYDVYLSSDYGKQISQSPLPLSLVTDFQPLADEISLVP